MTELRIWPATDGPGAQVSDTSNYALGVEFYVTASAQITEIRFWASTARTGTYTGRLYEVDEATINGTAGTAVTGTDVTFGAITGPGWNTAVLAAPVALDVGQNYRAVVQFNTDNGYTATAGYWTVGGDGELGITNGILVAPSADDGAIGGKQGSFVESSSMAFPTGTAAANYWVDVTVEEVVTDITGSASLPLGGLTLSVDPAYLDEYADDYGELPAHTGIAHCALGGLTLGVTMSSVPPAVDPDVDGLNLSLWAVSSGGAITPLPHFLRLSLSRERNGLGKISVDYPYYGRNFDLLANNITADRDLEVEIWVSGKRAGALRGILTDTTGDDVAEDAVWRFEGWFLEVLLDEVLVWPQSGAEKQELVISGWNAGAIAATVLTQVQARGGLVGVTRDFTTSLDSAGNSWSTTATMTFSPSVTFLELLQELVELGMVDGFELTAGRVLRMWEPGEQGADLTVTPPPTGTPVFRRGRNLAQSPRRHTVRNSGTTSLVAGADNLYASTHNSTAFSRRGRRIEIAGSANSLKDIGSVSAYASSMALQISPGAHEVTHGIVLGPGHPRPLIDFFGGDWVWSDTRGSLEKLRVWQLELEYGVDGYAGTVVLNTPITDRIVALARKLKRISSGTAVVGTSSVEPEVDDGKTPAQVLGLTASSSAYVTAEGVTLASVQAGWTAVTTNSDTSAADDIAGYLVAFRYLGGSPLPTAWQAAPSVTTNAADWSGLLPDQSIGVRAAAYDRTGRVGAWSAEYTLTTGADATPPPTPSIPTVEAYLGILTVAWDGEGSAGEPMPVDFDRVDVHISTSSGFGPGTSTLVDSLRAKGTVAWDGGSYATTYYAKLVAYDKTGNASSASSQDSATLARALADDIADDVITAAKLSDSIDWGEAISPESITTKHLSIASFADTAIPNGAFEDVDDADATMPERWTKSVTSGGTTTRTTTEANVASGAAAMSLALTAASGHLEILSAPVPTAPGDLWCVEVDAKASRALTGLQIVVGYSPTTDVGDMTETVTSSLMAITTSYTAAGTLSFTVPATAGGDPVRYVWIAVGAGQVSGDGASATVYVDNVRLRQVVGTAEIADAAIVRAKIGNLAVGDAQIEDLAIGKLTAGIMSAIMTLSGIIRTASSGDRVEIDADGIHCYDGTDLVFDFDISAGTVYVRGTLEAYQSANDRIKIQPSGAGASGVSLPEISLYAQTTSPAYINAFDAGSGRTGAGINSGNSADSGTTRRQTTLQLRPSHFVLFYNTAPGDSAGASANRGARVYGDDDEASVSLYDSSGLRVSGVDVQDDELNGQIFDGSGVREGGYFWLRRAIGDTFFGHFDGDVDTYLKFAGDGIVTLRRDTNQYVIMGGAITEMRHASGIRLTMDSSDTILGQGGNTYIQLNNSGNIEFYEGGTGYSSLASLKSFVIDHPTDPDRLLVHVCTESPTAGVEYAGHVTIRGGRAQVELPDYFEALCETDGRTAQLTPVGTLCRVAYEPIADGRFVVLSDAPDGTRVDWHVRATRRGAAFDVEPRRDEVTVGGTGPYRYIQPTSGAEQ